MKKKSLKIVGSLIVFLTITLVGITLYNSTSYSADVPIWNLSDYTYTKNDTNKTITITKYNGADPNILVNGKEIIDGEEYQVILNGGVFNGKSNLESIIFESGVKAGTNLNNFMKNCSNLKKVDFNDFDTSNVTTIASAFYGLRNLTDIDLSNFDTSKVTNMNNAFNYCTSLTTLDLSNFDTSKVTNMQSLFSHCSNLTNLNLSSFNTSSVTNMYAMFNGCTSLTTVDLSSFDTTNVTTMQNMFNNCTSLKTLDISNFDTTTTTNLNKFLQSNNLEKIKIGPKMNFKLNDENGYAFGRGKWKKLEDGLLYNAVDVAIDSSIKDVSGTYIKISNIIDEMVPQSIVTYKIEPLTEISSYQINGAFVVKNNKEVYITNLNKTSSDDYLVPGDITLTLDDKVIDAHGNKYDLEVKFDNIHLYDINEDFNSQSYSNFVYKLAKFDKSFLIYNWYYTDIDETKEIYTKSPSKVDVTIRILNKNGNAVDGSYLFSAFDLDQESTKGNIHSEGVNLISGYDVNYIKMHDKTFLLRTNNYNGQNGVTRIYRSHDDESTELSEFVVKSEANNFKFAWTGEHCGTLMVSYYQPQIVEFEKTDKDGNKLSGAKLEIYDKDNDKVDEWTTTNENHNMFLMPGRYILKEVSAPDGYALSEDIEFYVDIEDRLTIDGNTVEKIVMTNNLKKYTYKVNYYEKGTTNKIKETKDVNNVEHGTAISSQNEVVEIEGYEYDSLTPENLVVDSDNKEINIYYTRKKNTYKINYVDKETNEQIKTSKTEEVNYGTTINASDEIIDIVTYEYDSSDKSSITVKDSQEEITLYYIRKNNVVVTRYIDEETKEEIGKYVEITGKIGSPYETDKKEFEGYTFVKDTGNITGTYKSEPIEVIYYYKKIKYKIETEVINGSIDPEVEVLSNNNIRITYKEKEGYKLKEVIIDGNSVDISKYPNGYEFKNINNNHKIKVVYEKEEVKGIVDIPKTLDDIMTYVFMFGGSILFIILIVLGINKTKNNKKKGE